MTRSNEIKLACSNSRPTLIDYAEKSTATANCSNVSEV